MKPITCFSTLSRVDVIEAGEVDRNVARMVGFSTLSRVDVIEAFVMRTRKARLSVSVPSVGSM